MSQARRRGKPARKPPINLTVGRAIRLVLWSWRPLMPWWGAVLVMSCVSVYVQPGAPPMQPTAISAVANGLTDSQKTACDMQTLANKLGWSSISQAVGFFCTW